MPPIDKLINLLAIWDSLSVRKKIIPRAWLYDICLVMCMLIAATFFLSALTMCGLFCVYSYLIDHGMQTSEVVAVVAAGLAFFSAALLWATAYRIKKLCQMASTRSPPNMRSMLPEQLSGITDAFLDGLLRREVRTDKSS